MPFTPFHIGPGIAIKALLQGSFSLMVFGWTQVVMDLQPLLVILTGQGHLHGFSHTYIGATLIAVFCALSGKYLAEFALRLLSINAPEYLPIAWWVAVLSAFVGSYSHVLIDSIMHVDMQPLFPFSNANSLLGGMSVELLHRLCIYLGVVGSMVYFIIYWRLQRYRDRWSRSRLSGNDVGE